VEDLELTLAVANSTVGVPHS